MRYDLSKKEIQRALDYTQDIIDNLSDAALNELLSGYSNDVDKLFDAVLLETHKLINLNAQKLDKTNLFNLTHFTEAFDSRLIKISYNYFKTRCLPGFHMGWRNLEWGNMIQMYPRSAYLCQRSSGKSYEFCFAAPLWRLFSYDRPHSYLPDTIDNKNRRETMIITNESTLGKNHLSKIVEEIRNNDILRDRLNFDGKAELNKEMIVTSTGSLVKLRTYGSSGIRGNHVGAVFVDDFLDKSALYSKEQRDKFLEIFKAEIVPTVEPGGFLIVSGTPFHERDLYYNLKTDNTFVVFEYPAVFPDGRLLAPDRFTFEKLIEEKESLGSIMFAREYLVMPISDSTSIFPWEYLSRAFIGMENISFVENIESYPIKMRRVVIGCDFARSGGIGADRSVFSVWGEDSSGQYHLMKIVRLKGASHNEQINTIVSLNQQFKANTVVCEINGFQQIMASLLKQRGLLNVEEFTTTAGIKKDLYDGLPSLSALFERGQIKIPYAENSRDIADWLCGEFNSIGFNEDSGKLESLSEHDDGPMSSFIAITNLREKKNQVKLHFI